MMKSQILLQLEADLREAVRITEKRKAEHAAAFAQIDALKARVAELEAGLRFYGDVSKYPAPLTGGAGELYFDCGETARALLAKPALTSEGPQS